MMSLILLKLTMKMTDAIIRLVHMLTLVLLPLFLLLMPAFPILLLILHLPPSLMPPPSPMPPLRPTVLPCPAARYFVLVPKTSRRPLQMMILFTLLQTLRRSPPTPLLTPLMFLLCPNRILNRSGVLFSTSKSTAAGSMSLVILVAPVRVCPWTTSENILS